MKEKDTIILVGDIHGEFGRLRYDINRLHENSYIIQVGDFGVGFHKLNYYEAEFEALQKVLEHTNCHLYVIRGNHDNPEWFKETNNPFDYDRITLLKDYSELNLLGKNILLVGGAVSIDREWRIAKNNLFKKVGSSKRLWWDSEPFIYNDNFDYKKYDVVVTHTRPANCGSFKGFDKIKGFFDGDDTLKEELIQESQDVEQLWDKTKPQHWYYGHFHESNLVETSGTIFRCLDIDEHYQYFVLTNPDSSL
jgi:predicted phosphodiesterase